ncbi:MAG: PrsW family intramembrane metalloprotease, partial [Vallitaleaceae bacterium]|nr:PrsW family intramembrane metalloprotease [Vallitaleaceae bacterium]
MSIDLWITAITPGIALALMIYFYDRFDREPFMLILKLFLFGIFVSIPVLFVEMLLSLGNIFPGMLGIAYTAFIVAGLTEEFFKRWVVLRIGFKHSAFNEKLDGIVYAVMTSLGFATLENVMYVVFSNSDTPYI